MLIRRGPGVGLLGVWGIDDRKYCWLSGTIKEWRREEAFDEEHGVRYPADDPIDEADDGSVIYVEASESATVRPRAFDVGVLINEVSAFGARDVE